MPTTTTTTSTTLPSAQQASTAPRRSSSLSSSLLSHPTPRSRCASEWSTACDDDDTVERSSSGSTGDAVDKERRCTMTTRRRRAPCPPPSRASRTHKSNAAANATTTATATSSSPRAVRRRAAVTPPTYPQRVHTTQHHGHTRHDPYHWLRNRKDVRVRRLLRRENAHTEQFYHTHAPTHLRRTLYREMRARCADADASLPTLERHYWYYTRHVPGEEHVCYCRRPYDAVAGVNVCFVDEVAALWRRDPAAPLPAYDDEVVFLDLNALQRQLRLRYVDVGDMDVSPDEAMLAVTLDCSDGAEEYVVLVLPMTDVRRPRPHAARSRVRHTVLHRIDAVPLSSEVVWVGASALLYIALDAKQRPYRLLYHDLAIAAADDDNNNNSNNNSTTSVSAVQCCYEEADEAFWLGGLGFTADEHYVVFSSASSDVAEWYVCATCALPTTTTTATTSADEVPLRGLVAAPRVQTMCDDDDDVTDICTRTATRTVTTTTTRACCFARRCASPLPVEYDLDHHATLLAPHTGAWLVTSNAHGCSNFGVFFVPDEEAVVAATSDATTTRPALTRPEAWRQLFAYSEAVNVQGVECLREVLLVSVRRGGSRTVLLCPVVLLHRWWRSGATQPVDLDTLTDLSVLCARMHVVAATAAATSTTTTTTTRAQTSSGSGDEGEGDGMWSPHCFACSTRPSLRVHAGATDESSSNKRKADDTLPALSATVTQWCADGVRCTPLPWSVDAYTYTSSFDSVCWRAHVSHLLHPDVVFVCELAHDADKRVCNSSDDSSDNNNDEVVLRVRRLREDVVHGPVRYDAAAYDGVVVWVPSDYSFVKRPHADAHAAPTHTRAAAVHVPVQLCWSRAHYTRGGNALLLRVYGSYGECSDGEFAAERLSLLDRGVVYGVAAVRGGGELGVAWRDAGRKLQRGTTVNDFVSVASYVQDVRVCAPQRLIAAGDSAGGFVVCAALNRAPRLFHGVVAAVPFVDCLATLLDDTLPLTVTEWDEFGNPCDDAEAYRLLCALSPVDTVAPPLPSSAVTSTSSLSSSPCRVVLPHVLLLTAWRDTRVGYWESLKLTARLREVWRRGSAQAGRVLLHYCDFEGAGHMGVSGRYAHLRELAREYAFVLHIVTCDDLTGTARATRTATCSSSNGSSGSDDDDGGDSEASM